MTTINDYFQVRVAGQVNGKNWNNIYWYDVEVAGTARDISGDILAEVEAAYTIIVGELVNSMSVTDISVANWLNASEFSQDNPALVGAILTTPMPRWITANVLFARRGTGYNYPQKRLPGVPEAATLGDDLTSGFKDAITDALDAIVKINTTDGWQVGMRAYNPQPKFGQTVNEPAFRIQSLTAVQDVRIGTQKTRR